MHSFFVFCVHKGKVNHAPQESIGGCSSPSSRPWARRWRTTNVCDVWPVRRQTYGYLPSRKASPPFGWYQTILFGDRGTCVLTTCLGLHSTTLGKLLTHVCIIRQVLIEMFFWKRYLLVKFDGSINFILTDTLSWNWPVAVAMYCIHVSDFNCM